jgi:TonB family protein
VPLLVCIITIIYLVAQSEAGSIKINIYYYCIYDKDRTKLPMSNLNHRGFDSSILNAQRIGLFISFIIHAGFILIFLALPVAKIIPHWQTIQLSFYSQPELSAANQSPGAARPQEQYKIVPKNNDQALVHQAHKNAPEATNVLRPEQVIVANKVLLDEKPVVKNSQDMAVISSKGAEHQTIDQETLHGVSNGNIKQGIVESKFGNAGAPAFIHQETPVYPTLARRLGKEGRVMLKLLIDASGKLQNIEVIEAAGFGFTDAAVEAVKKSTYAPGYRNGEKVASKALLPVRFELQ